MNKLSATLMFLCALCGAAGAVDEDAASRVTKQTTDGRFEMTESDSTSNTRTAPVYNYEEVIYEHFKRATSSNARQAGGDVSPSAMAFDIRAARQTQEEADRAAALEQAKQEIAQAEQMPIYTNGYCYFKDEVSIDRAATYAYLTCDFDQGEADLTVSLVPDFYARALIARPLYITPRTDGTRGSRIRVEQGAVLTANRSSINIASYVNSRVITKAVAAGAYKTFDNATTVAQQYLEDKKAANTTQETAYLTSDSGTDAVQTTNTVMPDDIDYAATLLLGTVRDIAKIIGEVAAQELPYTFFVEKNTMVFADLELIPGRRGLRGFDNRPDNALVYKMPEFDINTGVDQDPYDSGSHPQIYDPAADEKNSAASTQQRSVK